MLLMVVLPSPALTLTLSTPITLGGVDVTIRGESLSVCGKRRVLLLLLAGGRGGGCGLLVGIAEQVELRLRLRLGVLMLVTVLLLVLLLVLGLLALSHVLLPLGLLAVGTGVIAATARRMQRGVTRQVEVLSGLRGLL
jgi:hypothetical protein